MKDEKSKKSEAKNEELFFFYLVKITSEDAYNGAS